MAVFYVSAQTGDDSDNGTTAALAKATVNAGIDLLTTAGDILFIAPGTYREIITMSSPAVDGASGDHTKVVGDPDCEQFPGEEKGVVRITGLTADEKTQDTGNGTAIFYVNQDYIELHNLHVDGGGHTFASDLTTQKNSYGIRSSVDGHSNAFNCLVQAIQYGFRSMNTTNCIAVAGHYGFYSGEKHVHSMSVGGYVGFYIVDRVIDCLVIGGNIAGYWNCDRTINCASFCSNTGNRHHTGDIVLDCIFLGCNSGILNSGTDYVSQVSGSFFQNCYNTSYQNGLANSYLGPGNRRLASSTANYPFATDFEIGDGNNVQGAAILYSYNHLHELIRILKPDLLSTQLHGNSDGNNDDQRNSGATSNIPMPHISIDTDILGHPRAMGNPTSSFNGVTPSKRDIGPWEYSTVDHTASFATVGPGIEIQGEGVYSIDVPVQSGSSLTVSASAKWQSGATAESLTPGIVIKYKTGFPSSSLMVHNTGQQYFTGSQLVITSQYGSANANTFETIIATVDADDKDQIYDVQLTSRNSGSDSNAVFSDLIIS